MKITSQRTLLWVFNFALVAAMLALFWVMTRHGERDRREWRSQVIGRLEESLKKHGAKLTGAGPAKDHGGRVPTVLSGVFAGYVPPPERPKEVAPGAPAAAPDLSTLIEVVALWAPQPASNGNGGPSADEFSGVQLKIKSMATHSNIFFYRTGDVIGNATKLGLDKDATMQRYGGARIVMIDQDGIHCDWDKKQVIVKVVRDPEPQSASFRTGNRVYGEVKDGTGPRPAIPLEADGEDFTFTESSSADKPDTVDISQGGLKNLTERGELLIDQISFESTDGENETKNLKLKSLPPELNNKGFREGDVILKVDAEVVTSKESIVNYVKRTHKSKQQYIVTMMRDGAIRQVVVKVPRGAAALRNNIRGR